MSISQVQLRDGEDCDQKAGNRIKSAGLYTVQNFTSEYTSVTNGERNLP